MDYLQDLFEGLVSNIGSIFSRPTDYGFGSSYWIWGFLFFVVVLTQALSLGEKIWIMVRLFLPLVDSNLHVRDKDLG